MTTGNALEYFKAFAKCCPPQPDPGSDHARYGDNDRHQIFPSATPIRFIRRAPSTRQEHTQRHKEIPQHLCVGGQDISQQDISEFAILGLRNAANGNAFQGREEAVAAVGRRKALVGNEKEKYEEKEIGLWYDIPGKNGGGAATGQGPEEEDGEEERKGDYRCKSIGAAVSGQGVVGRAGRVFDQAGNVLQDISAIYY
ncbi:MAG: hypothetical protein Q9201_003031 [Fulgogasparrea decipioides]